MKALLFATSILLASQATPAAPTLSEVKKLQIQNAMQRVEIAQLRFENARQDLLRLMAEAKVEGYTLDLATMTYQKDEKPATPPPKDSK